MSIVFEATNYLGFGYAIISHTETVEYKYFPYPRCLALAYQSLYVDVGSSHESCMTICSPRLIRFALKNRSHQTQIYCLDDRYWVFYLEKTEAPRPLWHIVYLRIKHAQVITRIFSVECEYLFMPQFQPQSLIPDLYLRVLQVPHVEFN